MIASIIVAGAGGMGREVVWLAEQIAGSSGGAPQTACFADDDPSMAGRTLNGIPVKSMKAARRDYPDSEFVIAIGNSMTRRTLAARALGLGSSFATLIHPRVERSRWVEIGRGTVICAGCILTTNVQVGEHVQLNLACTLSHDVVLGDFVTLAPGVHISGNVRVETGATIGTGAVIINGRPGSPLVIGSGAIIGAAACVTKDVPPDAVVVGVPARARST